MSGAGDRLVSAGYAAGWRAAGAIPERLAYRLADVAADRAMARRGPAVVQYARNLNRVLGPASNPAALRQVTAAGLRSYARYWLETFRLPSMDHREVVAKAQGAAVGMHYLAAGVESGRGVVAVLPHSGNWDVAGLMLAQQYGAFTTVAERLRPESLYRRFVHYRESLGMEILPLTGGSSTTARLKERLRAGGIVCLVGDRDLTSSGVPVSFFGQQTRMPAGPAMLAALTGADLCVAHLSFIGQGGGDRGWRTHISAPVALPGSRLAERVRQGTQAIADEFERGIARYPADWHMLQPLWLADLPAGQVPVASGGASGREQLTASSG